MYSSTEKWMFPVESLALWLSFHIHLLMEKVFSMIVFDLTHEEKEY